MQKIILFFTLLLLPSFADYTCATFETIIVNTSTKEEVSGTVQLKYSLHKGTEGFYLQFQARYPDLVGVNISSYQEILDKYTEWKKVGIDNKVETVYKKIQSIHKNDFYFWVDNQYYTIGRKDEDWCSWYFEIYKSKPSLVLEGDIDYSAVFVVLPDEAVAQINEEITPEKEEEYRAAAIEDNKTNELFK